MYNKSPLLKTIEEKGSYLDSSKYFTSQVCQIPKGIKIDQPNGGSCENLELMMLYIPSLSSHKGLKFPKGSQDKTLPIQNC
jgi:hypothetical protein